MMRKDGGAVVDDGCVSGLSSEGSGRRQGQLFALVLVVGSHDAVDLLAHAAAASAHRGDVGRGQGEVDSTAAWLVEKALDATPLELAGLGWSGMLMSAAKMDQHCSGQQKSWSRVRPVREGTERGEGEASMRGEKGQYERGKGQV